MVEIELQLKHLLRNLHGRFLTENDKGDVFVPGVLNCHPRVFSPEGVRVCVVVNKTHLDQNLTSCSSSLNFNINSIDCNRLKSAQHVFTPSQAFPPKSVWAEIFSISSFNDF